MKDLYRSLTKKYLSRLMALAVFATATATASADVVDFGEMELGKEYQIKDDFNNYQGTFTAPKSGTVYCETPSGQQFLPYTDAAHSDAVSITSGGIVGNTFPYSFNATSGTTYYFYTSFAMTPGVFKMEMDQSLAIKESTAPDGSTFSAAGGGAIDITFNQAIALDKITVSTGNTSKGVTDYRVNNVFLTINLADILNSWYNNGTLVAGQKFVVKIDGLRSSADATALYGGNGVLELTYTAANAPIKMVSATNADGSYSFLDNATPSINFLSYFADTNVNGKYSFTFSAPLDPTQGVMSLQYGSSEGGDSEFYQETLTPTFSNDNKTLTIDVTGKLRRPEDMLPSGNTYDTMVLALNRLTGADGQYVYTETQGSLGSFYFSFPYKMVTANISSEFTPADSFDNVDSIEIYIAGYSSVFYDGIEFSWYENGERQSLVVDKADLKITTDKYDGAEIIVNVPASLKGKSDVTLSLYNLETADGADHSTTLSNVYNASMKVLASTPAQGAELASIKAGETISVTLNRSDLGLVQYEIYDLNPTDPDDACVSSRATLHAADGQEGVYTAERYANLTLYKAHTYRLDVLGWAKEEDARGTGYNNPAARASFTFSGSTEPYTFSSTKLVSIDPEEGSILESADQNVFTVKFDGVVTLNSSTTFVNLGQGMTVPFESMVPQNAGGQYANTWVLTVPAATMASATNALTLTIKAFDANNKLVEGNQGVEAGSYFSFEYLIDYNTPELTFTPTSESNIESLSTITVASELGLGRSWDNTVGNISVYKGRDYICDITNIKDGDEVTTDGGDVKVVNMTLNLPKEITEAGTYQVVIPRGFFLIGEQFSSYKNKAYMLIYTVGGENAGTSSFKVTTTPANGDVVASCDEIVLDFPGYEEEGIGIGMGKATISKDGGEAITLGDAQADWNIWNRATQPLNGLAAENGTYVVSFPEGYFILGDDAVNSDAFTVTFTVGEAGSKINFTSTPADGSTVESCDQIDIIFTDYEEAGLGGGKATISKDGGEAVNLGDAEYGTAWNEVVQPLNGAATEAGTYVVSFPAGYFILGDGDDSPAFTITFTVGGESGSKVNFTSTPADGSTVASCDEIVIDFPGYEEEGIGIGMGKATISKDGGEAINLGDAQTDWDIWNRATQPLNGAAAEAGTYVVSFPEGYFILGDDAINCPAFTITFTVSGENGINDITVDGGDVKYYDLNGVEVKNPTSGLYIIKKDNKVSKALIKK
jgi:hypothetical protein